MPERSPVLPPAPVSLPAPVVAEPMATFPEEDSLGPIPEWLKMELANAVSSNTISKNITTTGIGNVQEVNQNVVEQSNASQKTEQHIKVKPIPPASKTNGVNDTQLKHLIENSKNQKLGRTAELENEILKLKEELKQYQQAKNNHLVEDLEFLEDDYEVRPSSKKSFWSRRGSQASKSKTRSKICNIQ